MNSCESTTPIIARDDVVADGRVLRLEIEQRNGHVLDESRESERRAGVALDGSAVWCASGIGTSRPVFADS